MRSNSTPSRRPASVTSIPVKPPCSIAASSTTAPPRITSPRSGLMPRTEPRLPAGCEASSSISSPSASRVSTKPWTSRSVTSSRFCAAAGQVADGAAQAGQAHLLAAAEPLELGQRARDVLAQGLDLLRGHVLVGQELLADAHRAQPHRLGLAQPPALQLHDLHAAAADVDAEPVADGRGVGDGQVAVPGLLGAADHPHLEPRLVGDLGQQLVAVGGVADGAGGHGLHPLDAGGAQEVGEHGGRLHGSFHRLWLQRARLRHPGADPGGLADLVDQAPPARGLVLEHHQAEGVRPHVDHGHALHQWPHVAHSRGAGVVRSLQG